MKFKRINKVVASLAVVLLAAGSLIGCKPIFEKKPIPKEGDKAAATAPAAPATTAPAPAPAPAPAAAPEPAPAPVAKIEEVIILESTAASVPSIESAPVVDDGNDVVKVTPELMRKIQQALVNAGYNPGPVDGVSGAKTTTAIESFQKKNGIPAGKITKKTLRALGVDL